MWVVGTFVANAGLSFLLSLVVAGVLGPEEYGRFAVAATAAIVLCTLVFDWLRLSATRFCTGPEGGAEPGLRASLDAGYLAGAGLIAAGAGLAWLAGLARAEAALVLALTAAVAVVTGAFEYAAALARAQFHHRAYAILVFSKNILALALMAAAGLATGRAEWALAMFALGTGAAALLVRGSLRDPASRLAQAGGARLRVFARYGLPVVGANLAYQAIVLINRVAATASFGYVAAGQVSLATDVTIRLLLSAGAALDAYLFQLAVRRGAAEGAEAGHAQVARNMVVVTAVLVLLAVGYAAALPAFEALLVPRRFQGDFARISLILVPGVLAFCLMQFALSPIFQVAGRTLPLLLAALAAVGLDLALLAVLPPRSLEGLACVHAVSLVAGFLVALPPALRMRACWPPWRELAAVAAAGAVTLAALWPLRAIAAPWLSLAATAGTGLALYGALLIGFDVAGLRRIARDAAAPAFGARIARKNA